MRFASPLVIRPPPHPADPGQRRQQGQRRGIPAGPPARCALLATAWHVRREACRAALPSRRSGAALGKPCNLPRHYLPVDLSIKEGETLRLRINAPKPAGTSNFVSSAGVRRGMLNK